MESRHIHRAITRFIDMLEDSGDRFTPQGRLELVRRLESVLAAHGVIDHGASTRQVTILLTDLRGFTQLTESLPPDTLVKLLNRYYARMTHIIHRYGGVVDKFMGDGIMALFGAAAEGPDDLLNALRCAAEMQQVMDEINLVNRDLGLPALYMGIGVNTGEVVVAHMGSREHSEHTVIGDSVNLASRVEAHCLRGQVLLSENSFESAREYIEVDEPRRVYIKGKRDPVSLYPLQAVTRPDRIIVPNREERAGPRVPVDFPFRFNLVEGKSVSEQSYSGHALELSYHGLRGRVGLPLQRENEFRLSLAYNPLTGGTEDIYARVINATQKRDECEVTVEFTAVSPDTERAICHVVDRLVSAG